MRGEQRQSGLSAEDGGSRKARTVGLLAGVLVLAIGLSVRFPITSFSAILPEIGDEYGLSASMLAVLSSIPVILFGVASPLAWMSLAGLPASLIAPTFASRRQLRTPLIIVVSALSAIGVTGLAFGPIELAPVMVAVLGLSLSGSFGLAIALIVFTAPSVAQTAAFSATSQGVGYALAATGPLLLGLLTDAGLSWGLSLAWLLLAVVGQFAFGIAAARASLGQG